METQTRCKFLAFCLAIFTFLSYANGDTTSTIHSEYNSNTSLPCLSLKYSNHYTSINWYKESPIQEGIIRRTIKQDTLERYKNYMNRTDVHLTKDGFLVLERVKFSEAGTYKCYLSAKVGHKNNQSFIILNVTESLSRTTPTTWDVTNMFTRNSTALDSYTMPLAVPVDVSILSVLVGFFSLSLSKVLLCFMCVWGMTRYKKHQRKKLWS